MEIIDNIFIYLKACFQIIKVVRYAQNIGAPWLSKIKDRGMVMSDVILMRRVAVKTGK